MKNKTMIVLMIAGIILVIVTISVLSMTKNNNDNESNQVHKIDAQLQYLDYQITTLFNLYQGYYKSTSQDINWSQANTEVSSLYTAWNGMIIDFTNLRIENVYLTDFGRQLDNISIAIQRKNANVTVQEITNLYGFLPRFANGYQGDTVLKNNIYTKYYLLKAYSLLQTENWNLINENINQAINCFYQNVNRLENENGQEYNINKTYISLNELKNSIEKKDKELFNTKFQMVMEQIDSIH